MIVRMTLSATLLLALTLVGVVAHPPRIVATAQAVQLPTHVCPMHPDVRAKGPGKCPRCGMVLEPIDPLDVREYQARRGNHAASDRRWTAIPAAAGGT